MSDSRPSNPEYPYADFDSWKGAVDGWAAACADNEADQARLISSPVRDDSILDFLALLHGPVYDDYDFVLWETELMA